MLPITGKIQTNLGKIYEPQIGKIGYIKNMYFNNSDNTDWTLELYLYNKITKIKALIYSYELSAGQMITNSDEYILDDNNYLLAKSDVETVTFVLNGTES